MRYLPEIFLLIALICGSVGVYELFGLGCMFIFDSAFFGAVAVVMAWERV